MVHMLPPSIRCVLFDLDGVLLDARELHYETLNQALEEFGYRPISRDEHLSRFDGLSTSQKLLMLGIDDNRVKHRKQELTLEGLKVQDRSDLNSLPYKIGVCTNAVRSTLDVAVKRMKLIPDLMLSNEDIVRQKPSPDIYIIAMSNLSVFPLQTLIVEDSQHGIEAARKSGAHLMIVKDPSEVTLESVTNAIDCCSGRWERVEVQASGSPKAKAADRYWWKTNAPASAGESNA